jgi:hypothetical protein
MSRPSGRRDPIYEFVPDAVGRWTMWNTLLMPGRARLLRHEGRSLLKRMLKTILACVLVAGTLDIADALVFYGIRGTPPQLLLQAIASGLLGPVAFHGGLSTALLGLAIHYLITFIWAMLFIVASLKVPALRRYAIVSGTLYGLLIYAVMNYVVLPLSREVGHPAFHMWILINAVFALIFFMGLPIAFISKVGVPDEEKTHHQRKNVAPGGG